MSWLIIIILDDNWVHQLAYSLLPCGDQPRLWPPDTLWCGNCSEPSFTHGQWTEVRWLSVASVAHLSPLALAGTSCDFWFLTHCHFYRSCRKYPFDFTPEIFLSSQWAVLFICPQSKCYTRVYNQARFDILCIHCIHPHWAAYQSRLFILNTICHGAKGK